MNVGALLYLLTKFVDSTVIGTNFSDFHDSLIWQALILADL